MAKSRDAFRTISEVSDALDTPAHVLRFWESKFKQIKPVKRAGGRRYYRPDDMALLAAIKDLLHEQGHSIKDTQKMVREAGTKTITEQGHRLLGEPFAETADMGEPLTPAAPSAPVDNAQSDLFAGQEIVEPTPPRIEIVSATAVPDAATEIGSAPSEPAMIEPAEASEAPAPAEPTPFEAAQSAPAPIILPDMPDERDAMPSRLLASVMSADPAVIRANAALIAPLKDKLAALRDEMRHPW